MLVPEKAELQTSNERFEVDLENHAVKLCLVDKFIYELQEKLYAGWKNTHWDICSEVPLDIHAQGDVEHRERLEMLKK